MALDTARERLAKLLVERSYLEGEFVLASGRRSRFYFDCRRTTCFSEAMPLIGEAFLAAFRAAGTAARSVGGLTSGADPIANAVAYCSQARGSGPVLQMFSVRKERKSHGTGQWIEGCAVSPVAIVDDVVTSGGSVIRAIERARGEGLEVVHVATLVDREEGGLEAIQRAVPQVPVTALFKKGELDALRAQQHGAR